MILIPEGEEVVLVQQTDHARFAGELLALWRADGLPSHPHRHEILLAATHHDDGWREEDAVPRLDPATGLPHTFLSLPPGPRDELWRRGVARQAAEHPYAAALVHLHALALHAPSGDGSVDAYADLRADLGASLAQLIEDAGLDEEALRRDYRFVDLADSASLLACGQLRGALGKAGYSMRFDSGRYLVLDPFPLAGATRFTVPCRCIARRRYERGADLIAALAGARWRHREVRVVPVAPEAGV